MINTLANDGVIPRDGRNVSVAEFALAMQDVFGISNTFITHLVNQSKKAGLFTSISATTAQAKSTVTSTTGETFNLFDLYEHNVVEHDASLVRQNKYFEPD